MATSFAESLLTSIYYRVILPGTLACDSQPLQSLAPRVSRNLNHFFAMRSLGALCPLGSSSPFTARFRFSLDPSRHGWLPFTSAISFLLSAHLVAGRVRIFSFTINIARLDFKHLLVELASPSPLPPPNFIHHQPPSTELCSCPAQEFSVPCVGCELG